MTANTLYPSLTDDAWTNSSLQVIDQVISNFFLAENNQTYSFHMTGVHSYSYLLEQYRNNPSQFAAQLSVALDAIFSMYFPAVSVQVMDMPEESQGTSASIRIFLEITDNAGTVHNLTRLLEMNNMRITKITSIING